MSLEPEACCIFADVLNLVSNIRTTTLRFPVSPVTANSTEETLTHSDLIVYRVSNESATTDDFLRGVKEVQKEVRSLRLLLPLVR